MTEMLFILTTIFVAYVVYVMVNEHNETAQNKAPESQAAPVTESTTQAMPEETAKAAPTLLAETVKPATVKPEKPAAKSKPSPEKAKPASAKAEKTAAKTPEAKTDADKTKNVIRNPATGEVASATGNYLFTKRWIKDALVAEGLLDKVYKNNEIDEETAQKIKDAQAQLDVMEKYKA